MLANLEWEGGIGDWHRVVMGGWEWRTSPSADFSAGLGGIDELRANQALSLIELGFPTDMKVYRSKIGRWTPSLNGHF